MRLLFFRRSAVLQSSDEIGRCFLELFMNHRVNRCVISALYHIVDILSALHNNWHAYCNISHRGSVSCV